MKIKYLEDLEDMLTSECVDAIASPGSNESACYLWAEIILFTIAKKDAIDILRGYGAWTERELKAMPLRDLKLKLLWLAAWNVFENRDN